MRFNDILSETILNELKMSPGFLQKLANSIEGAKAGMEFEMCVPDVNGDDPDDFQPEQDYDPDQRTYSIDDVCDFFFDADFNSRRDIQRLRETLEEEFNEWRTQRIADEWDEGGGLEACLEYCMEDGLEGEEAEEAAAEMFADKRGRAYDRCWDKYQEDHLEDYEDSEWIEDEYENMSDIESAHNIQWPHWTEYDSSQEGGIGDLADEFSRMIGRGINWSGEYHGAQRSPGKYCLEPDGSVESDNGDKMGLEFVSPALPLKEMISDLEKVVKWAKKKGCETNESTGLHMNVSIPNFKPENFDYIKFAIFLGDEYILQSFGRTGNTYAKSAIEKIKAEAGKNENRVVQAFDLLKSHLQTLAGRLIHDGTTDKYTSINMKTGYAEVRSPGGDWLNEDLDKLTSTLNRIVVAFDAACSPEKYAKEYATKFYKLLSAQGDDVLSMFADYAGGKITADGLKIMWARKVINKPGGAKNGMPLATKIMRPVPKEWAVKDRRHSWTKIVQANSGDEAIAKVMREMGGVRAYYTATPVGGSPQPAPQDQGGQWGRWFVDFADNTQAAVSARNRGEAESAGYQLGRGRIVAVTPEDPNHREQLPVIRRWIVRFNDGANAMVDARDHHSAEQEALRTTNYTQDEISSIVLDEQ